MGSAKRVKIRYRMALFPLLAILAVGLLGLFSQRTFSLLRNSTLQVYDNSAVIKNLNDINKNLLSVHQNGFKAIAWTVSGYSQDKIDRMTKETLDNLTKIIDHTQKAANNADSQADRDIYRSMTDHLRKYEQFIKGMFDVLKGDYSAASMFMGSIDESYSLVNQGVQQLTRVP